MDSNRFAALLLTAQAALPAAAYNHVETVIPSIQGRFNVACSNVAQDESRVAPGMSASDYWEGRNDHYITELLTNRGSAVTFQVRSPFDPFVYPTTWGRLTEYAAIVCYPTPRTNNDPDYHLPGTTDVVPHMEAPGAPPKLITNQELWATVGQPMPAGTVGSDVARVPLITYSHGLTGSPISSGYINIMALLASNGYMVGAVFHGDPRISRVRIEDLGDFAYLLLFFNNVVEMQLMRPLSLKAFNDRLLGDGRYSQGIDYDRIGGFGASLGGEAMMHLMGAGITTTLGFECHDAPGDPRIKAAVGFVPYAGQSFLPAFCEGQSSAANITKPFLALSGNYDTTAPIRMMEMAANRMKGSRFLVQLDGVPHQFEPEYAGDLMTWMTTFLNAYLEVRWDTGAMARFIRMNSVQGGPYDHVTIDVHVPKPSSFATSMVREYHNTVLNHYFMAATQQEQDFIASGGAGPGWELTGQAFNAWPNFVPVDPLGSTSPVCRFYGGRNGGPNSHFFTAVQSECDFVKSGGAGGWFYEGIGFYSWAVDSSQRCPAGWLGVNRAYNNRAAQNDSNHRFSTSDSTMRDMESQGWSYEATVMCAPP
jgi:predicted dienelactone hydrolase